MKTIISTIILGVGMASSAMASNYYQSAQTYGAYNAHDLQPIYSIDALHALGKDNLFDMSGARLGFNLYSNMDESFRHQFSLNLGYLTGSDDLSYMGIAFEGDATLMPVTLGYDMNIELSDSVLLNIGGKAGVVFGDFEASLHTPMGKHSLSDDQTAFTCSVGAGLKFILSEQVHLKVGYEYSRSHFDHEVRDLMGILGQHVISLGFGVRF